MKEYIFNHKKIIFIILSIIIILIILSILTNNKKNNNNVLISSYVSRIKKGDIKLNDNSCDLDYALENNKIPYFNLNNETYNKINEEIMYNFLLRTCFQDGVIDYEASLNDNILSVAINISYETDDDLAYLEYKTYNIDTNTHTLINNQDILNKYNVSLNDITSIILERFNNFYEYELNNDLLDITTSFNDYLKILEYDGLDINSLKLYIDNKKDLYLYKEFELSDGMKMDEEYPNLSIKFKLN